MARTVIGRIGSWPQRWQVLLSLIISACVAVVFMRTVQAVHDFDFELDGNIVNDWAVSSGLFDWADFFFAWGNPVAVLPAAARPRVSTTNTTFAVTITYTNDPGPGTAVP
jgi:hypothetical protein